MTSYHNSFTRLSTLLYLSCFHIIMELSKSTPSLEIAADMFRSVSRDEADFITSHIQALYLGIYQGQIF